ncbi:hypothetical protein TNCV_3395691 [Trichonephila clavipes]|nr:hypothetical protein TNCV_3395691 [Trichonephila clavipes]
MKYERYTFPTTSSLGYWHHGFKSECPKPAPWCRSVSSPTDGVFSSGGTVEVGIILRSCTKVSDLEGRGVLVYGGIYIDGHTDLYIIRDGPLTAHLYGNEILDIIGGFLFRGRNRTNGMTNVFSRHESNRARLGLSRKTSCWPPTTPTISSRTGKTSSGRVEQNTPTRD